MFVQSQKKVVPVLDLNGNKVSEVELPLAFSYPVRKDLIRRAFLSSLTKSIQPKGRDPMAGKRTTAISFGINLGLARVPRVKSTGEAALAPNTVGGRLTFPPTPEKKIAEEINKKEKRLATISALSAVSLKEFVIARGHKFNAEILPIVVTDDIINLSKTKDILAVFDKIGVSPDIERVKKGIKIRAGKGKMRGRRYKVPKGPLIVIHSKNDQFIKAASNIPGVDVLTADLLSVTHLAPGAHPGRLTIFTKSAMEIIAKRFGGVIS